MRDAVGRMSQSERDRAERLAAQLAAAEEAAAREAEAAAAANQAELTSVRGRATFILRELQPPVVDAGLVAEVGACCCTCIAAHAAPLDRTCRPAA